MFLCFVADEVTLVNYQCVCDLDKGFYGTDRYNCRFDPLNCNKAGHQLDINGKNLFLDVHVYTLDQVVVY